MTESPPTPTALGGVAWVLHPVTLVALAVLLLNDHVLKAAWPGAVTGKLSDVAGLVLAPPVVTAVVAPVLRRAPVRAVGAVVSAAVGTTFALVKATAVGAAAASAGWSWAAGPSTVLRDPSDLLALPALGVSWWAFGLALRQPPPARAGAWLRTAVVLPVAGVAILATSAGSYPETRGVLVRDGTLAVVTGESEGAAHAAVATTDGRAWRDLDAGALPSPLPSSGPGAACVPAEPRRCYRAVPGRLAVEESADGGATWTDAWAVTPGRQRFLERAYPEQRLGGPRVEARGVAILPVGGGYVVGVATGRDGVLVRHEDGRWERVGFPTPRSREDAYGAMDGPPPLTAAGERIAGEYVTAALAAFLGLLLGGLAAARRWRRALWLVPLVSVGYAFVLAQGAVVGAVLGVTSVSVALALIAACLLLWGVVGRGGEALSTRAAAGLTALGAVTVVGGVWPVVRWSAGRTDDYDGAMRAATQLVGAGVVAMIVLGLAVGVRDRRRAAASTAAPDRGGSAG